MPHTIEKPEAQWREELDPEQFRIARLKGNERPYSGEYWDTWDKGEYRCRCCNTTLFKSESKYDAGDGWPSFKHPASPQGIEEAEDFSHNSYRIEVLCQHCEAHLGHVFDDGPGPEGKHYRINSASLKLYRPAG